MAAAEAEVAAGEAVKPERGGEEGGVDRGVGEQAGDNGASCEYQCGDAAWNHNRETVLILNRPEGLAGSGLIVVVAAEATEWDTDRHGAGGFTDAGTW